MQVQLSKASYHKVRRVNYLLLHRDEAHSPDPSEVAEP